MQTDEQLKLTRDEMESRRLEAAQDLLRGVSQSFVARKFGVSRTTASRWHRLLHGTGVESLRKRRAPGRPSRLKADQFPALLELFGEGASAFGFPDDRWTTTRLAAAIESRFGIRYDPDHVGRLMHKFGLRRSVFLVNPTAAYTASRYAPNAEDDRSIVSRTMA